MKLSHAIIQKQNQKIALTAAMRQNLQVLQMSQIELYELVREELNSNPLLDEDAHAPISLPELQPISISALQQEFFRPDDYDGYYPPANNEISPLLYAHKEEYFDDILREQIGTYDLPPLTEKIALYLVECLDERGYLSQETSEIAELLNVSHFEVLQGLYFIQSLSPAGVGARSLEECLTLQLAQGQEFNEYTLRIVSGGLFLLSQNKITDIAKLLDLTMEQAQYYCHIIRALNPIPSQGYAVRGTTDYIIPDAVIECTEDGVSLQLNNDFVPRIVLNRDYAELLPTLEGAEKKYVEDCLQRADTLLKSITERDKTLQRVILCIFELQPRFFMEGKGLSPMTMNDIAEHLGINVSTVSRAIQGKHVVCRRGTVSLRSLFTTGYIGSDGDAVSSETVKEKIRAFVAAENPKEPLSDAVLCTALKQVGIAVARRTVAKYREELGIPSSTQRKV